MSEKSNKFAREAPGVRAAELVEDGEYVHEYRGKVEPVSQRVRLLALAPEVTDEAVHDAFTRVAGQWHNPSTHPNVVTVHDRDTTPRPWLAVAEPDGQPLDTLQSNLSVHEVQTIIADVAEALRNANLYNSTHLALTPADIWVLNTDDGRQALVDGWGLERACRVAAGERPLSPFTAPELVDDPDCGTEETDVYGLGALAYFALTGHPPVAGGELEAAITESEVVPPSGRSSFLPAAVDDVILTALAGQPDARYDSAYAFQTALTRVLPEEPLRDTPSDSDADTDAEVESGADTETESGTATDGTEEPDQMPPPRFTTDSSDPDATDSAGPTEGRSLTRRAMIGVLGLGTLGGTGFVGSSIGGGNDSWIPNSIEYAFSDRVQWAFETGGRVYSSPVVVDGTVFVGSGDGTVYALSAADGTEQWDFETGGRVRSSPSVVDGTVYVGSDDSNVYALSAADGTEQWAFETGNNMESSPAVVDGTVYVGSDDSKVYALSADDGTEQWAFETGDDVRSSPAVVDGTVYVGSDDGKVYALSAEDGTEQWRFEAAHFVISSPAVVDGIVYVGYYDGAVYALSADDGTQQWTFGTGNMAYSSPAVVDGTVYVGSDDNNVYALSASDGTEQWSFHARSGVRSSPAVVDGTVYVGSTDGNLYALSASDGTEQWAFETGDIVRSSPSVVDGTVYIGSWDNNLYALETDGESDGAWRMYSSDRRNSGHSASGERTASPAEPSATITVTPEEPTVGESVTLSARNTAVEDGASIESYEWAVGADASFSAGGETLAHTFSRPGEQTIRLRVTDSRVRSDTTSTTLTVRQALTQQNQNDWPQFQRTTAHRSYAPTATSPVENISERWTQDGTGDGPAVIFDDVVYMPLFRGIAAYDADDGSELWTFETPNTITSPAVANGSVYFALKFADETHYVYSVNADDGSQEWRFETADFVDSIDSPPTVVDGSVYFGYSSNSQTNPQDELGGVYAVSATSGQQQWRQPDPRDGLSSTVDHAVAVLDDVVYVGAYALSAGDGSTVWTASLFTGTAPSVYDGTIYCGNDGGVVAFSQSDGTIEWQVENVGQVMGSPAVDDGTVYCTNTSTSGEVYALSASDGTEEWQVELSTEVHYGPIVAGETVFVAPLEGPLFALSTETGDVQWQYGGDSRQTESPVISGSTLYLPTPDGLRAITGEHR